MFRSMIGIFGARGAGGMMTGRLAGRQLGARKISTKSLQGPVPWHHRMGLSGASRLWTRRLETPTRFLKSSPARSAFRAPRRSFHSSKTRRSAEGGAKKAPESMSLSGRLKKLTQEYGRSAVVVYLALSALDFPFCFLLVRVLGTERIAVAEEFLVSNISKVIPERAKTAWHDFRQTPKEVESDVTGNDDTNKGLTTAGLSVQEAEEQNKAEPSLATQLALAYAIHKSLIFFRVPLAVAVTPKIVKHLRTWGWQIGKVRPKV